MSLFDDKVAAGRELSRVLRNEVEIDAVVIPFPKACKIGLEIAKNHESEIELRLSDYISAPEYSDARVGAVVEDGTLWIDDGLKTELDVSRSYIENSARIKSNSLSQKSVDLKGREDNLAGKTVAIVSDGLNNGFREAAAAGSLLKEGVGEIFVVSPVKSSEVMADIGNVTDSIISVHSVPVLSSVEACYGENESNSKIEGRRRRVA